MNVDGLLVSCSTVQFVLVCPQVLRFNAYFKQTVHESPAEYFRVRPVDIYYYLEDDSISVVEPHVENSGMPQGTDFKPNCEKQSQH